MRETKAFVTIAVLLIASCAKEPSKTGKTEKSTSGATDIQKATEGDEGKQPDPAEIEKELKRLEGVWNEVATELEGKRKETPADDDFMSIRTFRGDEMIEKKKGDDDKNSHRGKIRIDPTKTPKRLEFFVSGTKRQAKEVYELQGDELKVCSILGSNNFPSEMTGKKTQHLLVIYKRVKK
jgi:uncharacterized protein (TIGR03067 family)